MNANLAYKALHPYHAYGEDKASDEAALNNMECAECDDKDDLQEVAESTQCTSGHEDARAAWRHDNLDGEPKPSRRAKGDLTAFSLAAGLDQAAKGAVAG